MTRKHVDQPSPLGYIDIMQNVGFKKYIDEHNA